MSRHAVCMWRAAVNIFVCMSAHKEQANKQHNTIVTLYIYNSIYAIGVVMVISVTCSTTMQESIHYMPCPASVLVLSTRNSPWMKHIIEVGDTVLLHCPRLLCSFVHARVPSHKLSLSLSHNTHTHIHTRIKCRARTKTKRPHWRHICHGTLSQWQCAIVCCVCVCGARVIALNVTRRLKGSRGR